jgi:hypothetical protein
VRASAPKFAPASTSLLSWNWALDLLASSRNACLATTRPDGRPHVAPLWLVVVDQAIWFWTPETTTKGTNLANDNRVALHVESGDDVAIIEGHALRVEGTPKVLDAYAAEYDSNDLDPYAFWTVEVESALAWRGHLGSVQRQTTGFTPADQ